MTSMYVEAVTAAGFAVVPHVLDHETVSRLQAHLKSISPGEAVRRRGQGYYGIRDLLNVAPPVRELADRDCIRSLVDPILGKHAKVVRGIFFDKVPGANWKVAWHQDLTIAVRQKIEVSGFTSWSVKAGILHVQPPVPVMEGVLTLRLHLDDADETNGALKVIPGSHKFGRLGAEGIQRVREGVEAVTCSVPRGGALAMRPLLLHASSAAVAPSHRRVIHLEFSSTDLPHGLEWQDA